MLEYFESVRDFSGKNVPVLGGAGLLGSAVSAALASQNATPIIVDQNRELGEELSAEINSEGGSSAFLEMDLSRPEKLIEVVGQIEDTFGWSKGWVNTFYPRTEDWNTKLENQSLLSWRKNVDMHLNGMCVCSSEVARRMAERDGGSIVNIGSIYGVVAPNFSNYIGTDDTSPAAYSAIKGGISAYSKYLASYYGSRKVRVNTVLPGGICNKQADSFVQRYSEKTALQRLGEAREIASAVVFLLSDAASYITGVDMPVDGGFLAL
mgnify:CR=1 FL=1